MDLVDEGEGLPASQGGSQIATGEGPPASQGGSQITGSAPSWGRGRGAASLLRRAPVRQSGRLPHEAGRSLPPMTRASARGPPVSYDGLQSSSQTDCLMTFTTAHDEGIGERAASLLLDGLQSASQWLTASQSRLFMVDGTAHGGSDAEAATLLKWAPHCQSRPDCLPKQHTYIYTMRVCEVLRQ